MSLEEQIGIKAKEDIYDLIELIDKKSDSSKYNNDIINKITEILGTYILPQKYYSRIPEQLSNGIYEINKHNRIYNGPDCLQKKKRGRFSDPNTGQTYVNPDLYCIRYYARPYQMILDAIEAANPNPPVAPPVKRGFFSGFFGRTAPSGGKSRRKRNKKQTKKNKLRS